VPSHINARDALYSPIECGVHVLLDISSSVLLPSPAITLSLLTRTMKHNELLPSGNRQLSICLCLLPLRDLEAKVKAYSNGIKGFLISAAPIS
jgi:hypothetical protein